MNFYIPYLWYYSSKSFCKMFKYLYKTFSVNSCSPTPILENKSIKQPQTIIELSLCFILTCKCFSLCVSFRFCQTFIPTIDAIWNLLSSANITLSQHLHFFDFFEIEVSPSYFVYSYITFSCLFILDEIVLWSKHSSYIFCMYSVISKAFS